LLGSVASVLLLLGSGVASATTVHPNTISVNLSSYGALCNGTHDDRPALASALSAVQAAGGGTITVPSGTCRIVQTASIVFTGVTGPVTIQGASSTSTLSLDTDVAGAYRELLRIFGSNVVLQNLNLTRSSNVFAVFLKVWNTTGFTLNNVMIDGKKNTIGGADVNAIELSAGSGQTLSDMHINGSTIKNSTFGLFQNSSTLGTVNGVTVDHSTFTNNYFDDLEFNAPNSSMSNITVTNSSFSNNQYSDPSGQAGIGVGLANVQTAKVQNNTFNGYFYAPVHIEDRSSHITVDGNQFFNSFKLALNYASMVQIINNSHFITVTNNTFDTSGNTNEIWCVYAGAGGGTAPPSDISITGNTFKLRPLAHDLANYSSPNVTISGNTYVALP